MSGLLKGLQGVSAAAARFRGATQLGFNSWNARAKMNKLSNNPTLVGFDKWGNRYFEDESESFGARAIFPRPSSRRAPRVFGSPRSGLPCPLLR